MKTALIVFGILVTAATAGGQTCRVIVGAATYYTAQSCRNEGTSGSWTASGARYDESALTCALPKSLATLMNIRFGDSIRVTSLASGKKIDVRYLDTGPGRKAQGRGVVVDLTPVAWRLLGGKLRDGRMRVKIERMK